MQQLTDFLVVCAHVPSAKAHHMAKPTVWSPVGDITGNGLFLEGVLMHPQNWHKGSMGHYEGSVCMSHLLVWSIGKEATEIQLHVASLCGEEAHSYHTFL